MSKVDSKSDAKRDRSRSPTKTRVKSKRLLVTNIPFTTSLKELKEIFKDKIGICGKLDYIDQDGKFTGNALMEFKTLDGAQKAVDNMNKYSINGREIIVREETSKDRERLNLDFSSKMIPMGNANPSLMQLIHELEREGTITNSVFIANLHFGLNWQKVKDMLKAAGRVRHVDLKTDPDGNSRGFGVAEFETPEEAVNAIYLFNNKIINNREIKLRMDKSGKALVGRLDMSRFGDVGSNNSSSYNPQVRNALEDLVSALTNPNRSNPQALKALQELVGLVQLTQKQDRIPEPIPMKSNYDRNPYNNLPPIKGWNEMSNHNMQSDNYLPIQNYDSPCQERSSFSSRGGSSFNDFGRGGLSSYKSSTPPRDFNGGDEYGMIEDVVNKLKSSGNVDKQYLLSALTSVLSKRSNNYPSFSSDLYSVSKFNEQPLTGMQSNTLLIKNIPFSFTWKDLKHSFSQAPGIVNTEILRDDFNRSKGVGLVRFATPADALRCKNMMDGTLLDGRPIHIEFSHSLK